MPLMSRFTPFLSLRDNGAQTSYSHKVTLWEDKEPDYTIIQHYQWKICYKIPAVGRKMINISNYRLFCLTVIFIHLKWVEEGAELFPWGPLLYLCLDDDDASRGHINYIWPTRRFVPPRVVFVLQPRWGVLSLDPQPVVASLSSLWQWLDCLPQCLSSDSHVFQSPDGWSACKASAAKSHCENLCSLTPLCCFCSTVCIFHLHFILGPGHFGFSSPQTWTAGLFLHLGLLGSSLDGLGRADVTFSPDVYDF